MSNEATAARTARRITNPEFQVHKLNEVGQRKAEELAHAFDELLEQVKQWCPDGREMSLVKTHLEQACVYAKKAIAKQQINQQ